jgi:hypothetical protein
MPMSKKTAAAAAVSKAPLDLQRPFVPSTPDIVDSGERTQANQVDEALMPPPTLGEGVGASLRLETLADSAARAYVDRSFADEDYAFTPDDWKEATDGLPKEYHKHLLRARSKQHALWISGNIKQELDDAQTLDRMGGLGTGLRVGASVLDPAQALLAMATGPLGASAKATRLQNMFRSGLAAGTTNAAVEGFLSSQQATRDGSDVLEAGLLGFILGAPLGALSHSENAAIRSAARKGVDDVHLSRVADAGEASGVSLTDAGKKASTKTAPEVIYVDSQGVATKQSDRVLFVDGEGRASDQHRTRQDMDNALFEKARTGFLQRTLNASEGADDVALREEAARLWTSTLGGTEKLKPSKRQLAIAEFTLRRAQKAEKAAAQVEREALDGGKDAAFAQLEAQKTRETELAYAQRELQDAGFLPKSTEPKAEPAAQVHTPEVEHARTFETGDTVWYLKGDKLHSGKVERTNEHGRVVFKDDATGKLVVVRSGEVRPARRYSSGISREVADDTEMFKRGSASAPLRPAPSKCPRRSHAGHQARPLRDSAAVGLLRDLHALPHDRTLKKLASDVIADPVGYADKSLARGASATELAEMTRRQVREAIPRRIRGQLRDYFKRVRPGITGADAARSEFAEAITLIARRRKRCEGVPRGREGSQRGACGSLRATRSRQEARRGRRGDGRTRPHVHDAEVQSRPHPDDLVEVR